MELRKYQSDALDAIYAGWRRGITRPAVVMATGLGKTVIFSHLIARWCAQNPGLRVLVLVHRDELATQAREKIQAVSGLRVGIVKASQNDVDAPIVVASVQTLARPHRRDAIRGVGLIIADECHHAAARTWREVMAHYGAWEGALCVGFTATMHREDNKGLGEVWQEVVMTRDIVWGVRNNYLLRPRGLRIRIPQLHLEDRSLIVAGDYQRERVGQAMINADTGPAIARAVEQYASGLRMVTFAPNVAAAEHFAEYLNPLGGAELITGKTPRHARLAAFARFQSGHTLHLVNAMVLTEGWDAPWCDGALIARPTKNPGLFQQMVGRALRPHGNQTEALIIDVAGATEVSTLVSLADLGMDPPEEEKRPKDPIDLDEDDLLDPDQDPYLIEPEPPAPVKEVHATEVDFLGAPSHYRWRQTRHGIPYLYTPGDLVFLWPEGGELVTVAMVSINNAELATPIARNLVYSDALQKAQGMADELGYTTKPEAWRQRPASWNHIRKLSRLGVSTPADATTGQVEDLIEQAIAERKIHP